MHSWSCFTGFSTENGTSYEWQSSNDNFVTNIVNTGQTDPNTFNTGVITSTTYFRLKVTCASNNSMDFSNIVTITINPLPVLICPEDFDICVDAPILDLTTLTYSPTGGTFSGPGVSGNNFNPFVATPRSA